MQKNRTSAPLLRGVRQGIALFLTAVALWIVYLTADPAVALEKLKQLAQLDQLTAALVNLELPWDTQPATPLWQQVILGQSSLLAGAAQATPAPVATEAPQPTATPEPKPEEQDKTPEEPPAKTTTAPDGIIPSTLKATNSPVYTTQGNVSIRNYTDYTLDIKALLEAAPKLTPAPGMPELYFVLLCPEGGVSSAACFSAFDALGGCGSAGWGVRRTWGEQWTRVGGFRAFIVRDAFDCVFANSGLDFIRFLYVVMLLVPEFSWPDFLVELTGGDILCALITPSASRKTFSKMFSAILMFAKRMEKKIERHEILNRIRFLTPAFAFSDILPLSLR